MNNLTNFFPSLQRHDYLYEYSSSNLLKPHHQSTHKFALKNIKKLHQHYAQSESCDQHVPIRMSLRETKHKQFKSQAIKHQQSQTIELLSKAKEINNKYFRFYKQAQHSKQNTNKENNISELHSLKRYRSFRNKWFTDKQGK